MLSGKSWPPTPLMHQQGVNYAEEGTKYIAGYFPAERSFNPDRGTVKAAPSGQRNNCVTISQKDNPYKPHPLEKMIEG